MARKEKSERMFGRGKAPKKASLFVWLRGRFLAGIVLAAPIAITFLILQFLITKIDESVVPLLPAALKPETYLDYAVPGFGLIVLVLFLTLLGAITTNLIGRSIVTMGDRILSRVPFVNWLYAAFKQLIEVFASDNSDQFNEVVLIEFPKEGTWCIGFLSSPAKGEIESHLGSDFIGVFVPTTPNPTSGFLMYVPRDKVIPMAMSVEEGAKIILSAGLVVPEFPAPKAVTKDTPKA